MKIKTIAVVAVLILGLLVTGVTVSKFSTTENEYNTNLAKARANAEKLIPYNAYN